MRAAAAAAAAPRGRERSAMKRDEGATSTSTADESGTASSASTAVTATGGVGGEEEEEIDAETEIRGGGGRDVREAIEVFARDRRAIVAKRGGVFVAHAVVRARVALVHIVADRGEGRGRDARGDGARLARGVVGADGLFRLGRRGVGGELGAQVFDQ
jgi:hypothetical protein